MNRCLKRGLGLFAVMFGCSAMFTLHKADLVLNATDSMIDDAYLVYEWPLVLRRGAVVSSDMPSVLAPKFGDFQFVKVIRGVPGDTIVVDEDGTVCVAGYCADPVLKDGKPWGPAISSGVIPADHYAVFGTSEDSLDSRYDVIGLIPAKTIRGTGFAIPFPKWEDLSEWL